MEEPGGRSLTINVELVELRLDRLGFFVASEQSCPYDVDKSGTIDVEAEEEIIRVYLASLAVALVEDGFGISSKRRSFAPLQTFQTS